MPSKKGFVIPLIIAIVAILAIGGVVFVTQKKEVEAPVIINPISTTTPIVGGDKDEHGCLGSAGYSWCAVKNKCLRVWEEKCEMVSTSTVAAECIIDSNCREISCVGGGFAHELCTQGKCTMSVEVKKKCSGSTSSCTPDWVCGWAPCINGYQGMTAVDSNNCNIPNDGVGIACPAIARECTN